MVDGIRTGQITQLLRAVGDGDSNAREELWRVVYAELRAIAQAHVAREARQAAIQPTTLVHEAFLRLSPPDGALFENRRHFFAAAAEAMRRICVDNARKRKQLKRGGGKVAVLLDHEPQFVALDPLEVLAVDEALGKLEQFAPRQARVVAMRYFGGLTCDETAEALELSARTVRNEWRLARAWLYRELVDGSDIHTIRDQLD
jgi:RNA polymerase sigma factor (TIGR02999 family)